MIARDFRHRVQGAGPIQLAATQPIRQADRRLCLGSLAALVLLGGCGVTSGSRPARRGPPIGGKSMGQTLPPPIVAAAVFATADADASTRPSRHPPGNATASDG